MNKLPLTFEQEQAILVLLTTRDDLSRYLHIWLRANLTKAQHALLIAKLLP